MNDEEFNDFGFTAVDAVEQLELTSSEERLDEVYKMILPLLQNLKKNPDKDYIKWPNRVKVIESFEEKLKAKYEGTN